jgi:hypothetical protein
MQLSGAKAAAYQKTWDTVSVIVAPAPAAVSAAVYRCHCVERRRLEPDTRERPPGD